MRLAGLVLLLASLPVSVSAQVDLGIDAQGRMTLGGDDARVIAQVAQRVGNTDFEEDVIGRPKLIVHAPDDSVWFEGNFVGCAAGKDCQLLVLMAEFGVLGLTAEQINSFNSDHFHVRAYIDLDQAVFVEQDISLVNGVNDQWLEQSLRTFGLMADTFEQWAATAAVEAMIERLTRKD